MENQTDFERLIETWRGALVAFHAARGAPAAEAGELAQDTLVEAWLGRERLRGDWSDPKAVGPWLRGIARHLHRDWRRRRQRGRQVEHAEERAEVEERAAEDPRQCALRIALDELPRGLRTVVYLRYVEETPVRLVASLLGVSEKTVEGRLYRARARLRDRIGNLIQE